MFDHMPNHQSRLLPAKQVPSFFADLATRNHGHALRVAVGEDAMRNPETLPLTSLESIELETRFHKEYLIIKTADSDAIRFRVITVWVIRDENGRVTAVEVTDNKDNKLVLYFDLS